MIARPANASASRVTMVWPVRGMSVLMTAMVVVCVIQSDTSLNMPMQSTRRPGTLPSLWAVFVTLVSVVSHVPRRNVPLDRIHWADLAMKQAEIVLAGDFAITRLASATASKVSSASDVRIDSLFHKESPYVCL